jgi:sigma-B regulation protein RsbU (phosphoserine phosphatase)
MSSTRLAVNREQLVDMTDLQRARQIQLNFLPRAYPRRSTCEIYGYNNSSNLVGGDYFDFFDDRPDSFQCILADACGHGLAAALIMSNFRGLLKSEIVQHESFSGLFNQLNFLLHFDDELIQYLTGVFLNYDPSTGALEYLNAGHYDPLVITKDGTLRSLTGGGPPLGMFKGSTYPLGNTVLELGDLVVLYTDGLVDVQNGDGDYFGSGGITRTVLRYRGIALDQIADEVIQQAGEFAGSSDFEDDVTIFLFKVK